MLKELGAQKGAKAEEEPNIKEIQKVYTAGIGRHTGGGQAVVAVRVVEHTRGDNPGTQADNGGGRGSREVMGGADVRQNLI